MQTCYRLIRRGTRADRFYCVDKTTGKRTSLQPANEDEARQLVEAKNNADLNCAEGKHPILAYFSTTGFTDLERRHFRSTPNPDQSESHYLQRRPAFRCQPDTAAGL